MSHFKTGHQRKLGGPVEIDPHPVRHENQDMRPALPICDIGGCGMKILAAVEHAGPGGQIHRLTDVRGFVPHLLARGFRRRCGALGHRGLERSLFRVVGRQAEAGILVAARDRVHTAIGRVHIIQRQPAGEAGVQQRPQIKILVQMEQPVVAGRFGNELVMPQPHGVGTQERLGHPGKNGLMQQVFVVSIPLPHVDVWGDGPLGLH